MTLRNLPALRSGARILFITNTRIGDVVLSTGLLGLLSDTFPTARITVVAGPSACSLFAGAPGVERVIPLRKERYYRHWARLYLGLLRPWDLIIDLRGSGLAWLLPTLRRRIVGRSDAAEPRVVELGRLLGAATPPAPRVWIQASDRQAAARRVPTDSDFLAVAPGAGFPEKQWPPERFAAMIDRLTEPRAVGGSLAVTLLGAPEERPIVEAVCRRLADRRDTRRPIAVLGEPHLPVVAAILERARLFIGNDSGLMHLAAAAGAPTVGLFGPTPPARYRPWGVPTLVIQSANGRDEADPSGGFLPLRPMIELDVERVVAGVSRFAAEIGLATVAEETERMHG